MPKSSLGFFVFVLMVGAVASNVWAQNIAPGTISPAPQLQQIATLTSSSGGAPNFGVHSGDARFLYVGEQNGTIRILDFNQANPLSATVFLNIDAALGNFGGSPILLDDTNIGERGLLGAAFHPDFNNAANPNGFRKFYTFTSETFVSGPANFFHQSENPAYNHQSVIREWTANSPNANGVTTINTGIASRVVVRIAKPGQFHNGGSLVFGPDRFLYISTGDGGVRNDGDASSNNDGHTNPNNPDTPGGFTGHGNAQDRRNVYGKILRIKPTTDADPATNPNTVGAGFRVPKTNPFTPDTNAQSPIPGFQTNWADEIYARGFRNPFRISFDRDTGELYAADVGQDRNTSAREEVSRIVNGGNYGWIIRSGTQTTEFGYSPVDTTLIDPLAQYPTTQLGNGGLAAIGGFVYRGDNIAALDGKFIFADLNRGDGTGGRLLYTDFSTSALTVFDLNLVGGAPKPSGAFIHGVAEDAMGEIYFLFGNGQVMKLVPEPSTWALAAIGAALVAWKSRRRSRGG